MTDSPIPPEHAYARAMQRVDAICDEAVRRCTRYMRACGVKTIDIPPGLKSEIRECFGALFDIDADLRKDLGAPPFEYDWLSLGQMFGRSLEDALIQREKPKLDPMVDTVPHWPVSRKKNRDP